ncbi:MAG: hypothetical protein DMF81_18705 [Acidobacteria bacterium]|nr:MAG: hypothetical protein DMF81_18705 [Acidobacteriota bacterium]
MPVSAPARERPDPRTSGVLAAAVASALVFSAGAGVPFLGLLAVAAPFPLIVLRVRGSLGAAVLAALLAAVTIGTVFSTVQAVGFLAILAAPGLLMGETMARGRVLRRGCAWAFALGAALLFAGPFMQNLALEPLNVWSSPQFQAEMRSSGLPAERVEDLSQQFLWLREVLRVVYPAVFVIGAALTVIANATLLAGYLARRDPGWLEGGEFEEIRWPLGLSVVFVIAGAAVLAPDLRPAAYNVLLVVGFFYALQGLAVVAYYAYRLAAPPLLRVALMVLVLVNPWAPQILGAIGLFDTWFDFRKYARPPAPAS